MTPEEQAKLDAAKAGNKKINDDRLSRMEAIADANDTARNLEDNAMGIKDDAAEREARAIAEDEEAARLLQTEGAGKDLAGSDDGTKVQDNNSDEKLINGVVHYLTVVNGREKWLTLKQLRDISQKVEAADEYLHNASEAVKNASRLALSKQDEPVSLEKDEMKKLLASVALGDEEAIEKLASALSRPSEVTPDVVRQIDQRLSFRTELASLESKSKDLLEDPYMGRLFRSRLGEMKQENPTMGLSEAYTSIDKELRTAFPARSKDTTKDKLERKRTLVNVPTAASRQATEEEPEGEDNVTDTIAKMAEARQPRVNPYANSRRQ
jgi:hypothetical protein